MEYSRVKYANRDYVVCKINYHKKPLLFVVNARGFRKLRKYKGWVYKKCGYIGRKHVVDNKNKVMYLHNLVMNKLTHDGKGQKLSVDHINRIGTDNRKKNLRFISQSHQNNNQRRKKRRSKLPEDCGFTWEDVPKSVWYVKPTKTHKERFCVDIKTETLNMQWYTTSSRDVSLKFKLEHMKKYLRNLRNKYPDEFQKYNICNIVNKKAIKLTRSYNNILRLSGYDCVDDNIIPITKCNDSLKISPVGLTKREKKLLTAIEIKKTNNRNKISALPEDCGIRPDMIPKYCYYQKPRSNRSCAFCIDKRHPKLDGKPWRTTSSKKVSIKDKYKQLIKQLKTL